MRKRTRTIVNTQVSIPAISALATREYCGGLPSASLTFNSGAQVIDTDVKQECIRDELGKASVHPVKHRVRHVICYAGDIGEAVFQDTSAGYVHGNAFKARWPYYFKSYTDYGVFTGFDVEDNLNANLPPAGWTIGSITSAQEDILKEDVFEKANQLKADVLLNIIEANQMHSFIKPIAFNLPNMRKLWPRIRRRNAYLLDRVDDLLTQEAYGAMVSGSGHYLMYQFGLKPLTNDMLGVNRSLRTLAADVKRFVDGDKMRFSSTRELSTACSLPRVSYPLYGQTYASLAGTGKIVKPATVRYVLVVKPNSEKYLTDFFQKAEYFMSRYATSPASLAWELVPFSFVVDWFVDLRGVLRLLDKIVGFEPYEVVGFTRSYSYHLQTDMDFTHNNTCNGATVVGSYCGTVEFKHYDRSLVSDGTFWPTWKPRFGKNQAGISAALIAQALLKRI